MEEKKDSCSNILLQKFQFIMVNEKETYIDYPGVKDKGPRPYLVVRANLFGKLFLACPISSSKIEDHVKFKKLASEVAGDITKEEFLKKAKRYNLVIDFDGVESFVKMGLPIPFSTKLINEGKIVPLEKHLKKSLRNVAIKLIQDSFEL